MKLLFLDKNCLAFIVAAAFFIMSSAVCFAHTKEVMSDSELSNVEGQALFDIINSSNINGSQNVIHIDLGIDWQVYAHFDSLKMGYYTNASGNTGWDVDITNGTLGSSATTPLTFSGFFLEVGFDNINNPVTRQLNYVDFGTESASGIVTGTINSVNGLMASNASTGNTGVVSRMAGTGSTQTITLNNEELSFLITTKYNYLSTSNLSGIFIKMPSNSGT